MVPQYVNATLAATKARQMKTNFYKNFEEDPNFCFKLRNSAIITASSLYTI